MPGWLVLVLSCSRLLVFPLRMRNWVERIAMTPGRDQGETGSFIARLPVVKQSRTRGGWLGWWQPGMDGFDDRGGGNVAGQGQGVDKGLEAKHLPIWDDRFVSAAEERRWLPQCKTILPCSHQRLAWVGLRMSGVVWCEKVNRHWSLWGGGGS
ncbi:uncharacterized protein B0T23DRAFT_104018 [Neurospora hispaniola]|uniref:Secreted protein n=1 Tax=Neurospora hispaniola TaxID=588809 RepID=A0AAJ0I9A6_9PEZI|nr:hypothetical protein B0T23DRAFT_104018 [Neurospora hispaniola]